MVPITAAHSGSQHDRSVLLKHPLLLLLKARDPEPVDLEASLKHVHARKHTHLEEQHVANAEVLFATFQWRGNHKSSSKNNETEKRKASTCC